MAVRRMISRTLIDTDQFLDLPNEAKQLYLFLNIFADDDGLIGNPKKIARNCGVEFGMIDILKSMGYIICFDSGVIAITHWLIHNYIRKDRYTPTIFTDEFNSLGTDENKVYFLITDTVNQRSTQVREGKDSEDKDSIGESKEPDDFPAPAKRGKMNNVVLSDGEYDDLKLNYNDIDALIDRLSTYIASTGKSYPSHYATLIRWAEDDMSRLSVAPVYKSYTQKQPVKEKAASTTRESSFDIDEFYQFAVSRDPRSCLT